MPDTGKNGQLTFDFGNLPEEETSLPQTEELNPDAEESDELSGIRDYEEEESAEFSEEPGEPVAAPAGTEESATSLLKDTNSEAIPEKTSSPGPAVSRAAAETGEAEEEVIFIESRPARKPELTPQNLKRAALAFLAALHPDGLAMNVPTRMKRLCADAAAFWSMPGEKKGSLRIYRTAIVEARTEADVGIECANRAELEKLLEIAKLERDTLEGEIRRTEPRLKDESTLFSEFEYWNYSRSTNPAYKECLKRIDGLEYALYHGSRSDHMRAAKVATELYLMVPAGTVSVREVADSWGLIHVNGDLTFRLVKEPEMRECPPENMQRLALNIAVAARKDVLFANGIERSKKGEAPSVGVLPHKRRRS
ncbi:MAG: hypothetical protein BWY31_03537 [Lentisphaerae bacterium ADurb.Bin242]|nr:MAG: hypothetical protein BWY31_03537 [Lentisphaerae bacterium ADurb.Bin242]